MKMGMIEVLGDHLVTAWLSCFIWFSYLMTVKNENIC